MPLRVVQDHLCFGSLLIRVRREKEGDRPNIPCRAVNSKNVWFLQSFLVLDADEVLFGFYLAIQRLRASTDGAEMVFKCEALSNRQGVSRATD